MVILDVVGKKTKPLLLDIVSVEKQAQYRQMEGKMDTNLHHRLEPRLQQFGSDFPAIEVQQENLTARYVPLAIRVTDCPLEEINTESGRGRTGKEIWENVVLPTFNI